MYLLYIGNFIKQMIVNKLRDIMFENYYKRIPFSKGNSYYPMKYQKKRKSTIVCN